MDEEAVITLLRETLDKTESDLIMLSLGIKRRGRAYPFRPLLRYLGLTQKEYLKVEESAYKKLEKVGFDPIDWIKKNYKIKNGYAKPIQKKTKKAQGNEDLKDIDIREEREKIETEKQTRKEHRQDLSGGNGEDPPNQ